MTDRDNAKHYENALYPIADFTPEHVEVATTMHWCEVVLALIAKKDPLISPAAPQPQVQPNYRPKTLHSAVHHNTDSCANSAVMSKSGSSNSKSTKDKTTRDTRAYKRNKKVTPDTSPPSYLKSRFEKHTKPSWSHKVHQVAENVCFDEDKAKEMIFMLKSVIQLHNQVHTNRCKRHSLCDNITIQSSTPQTLFAAQYGKIPTPQFQHDIYCQVYQKITPRMSLSQIHCGSIVELKFLYNKPSDKLYLVGCGTIYEGIDQPTEAFIFDFKDGTYRSLSHGGKTVNEVSVTCDNSLVATAGSDGLIKVILIALFPLEMELHRIWKHKTSVSRILTHHTEANLLISAGNDDRVAVWDIYNGTEPQAEKDIHEEIFEMAFGYGLYSENLIVAHKDCIQTPSALYFPYSRPENAQYVPDQRSTTCVCSFRYSPLFVLGGADHQALVYDFRSHESVASLRTAHSEMNGISISHCDTFLAIAGETYNTIPVFDIRFPSKPLSVLVHHLDPADIEQQFSKTQRDHGKKTLPQGPANYPFWTSTGMLVTGGEDTKVRIWDLRKGDPLLFSLSCHQDAVTSVTVTSEDWPGTLILASGDDSSGVWLHCPHKFTKEFTELAS
ncbi:hypothetical protein Pelo_7905 [Pelomyxa schiedti]|nr:hypothetical protein Pelo_7905 [Pelomyxa schiedti]